MFSTDIDYNAHFDYFYSMVGPAGMVLLFLVLIAIYIALKNLYYLSIVWRSFKKAFKLLEGSRDECYQWEDAKTSKNPLIALIRDILGYRNITPDKVRAEVNYIFNRNFERVTKDLSYLKLISVVSPLLGLLGTVVGMVDVFQAIAASASPDPTMLASGIWSALLTTIMGLSVAIPTLMVFYYLTLRFKSLYIVAIEYSVKAMNMCDKDTGK